MVYFIAADVKVFDFGMKLKYLKFQTISFANLLIDILHIWCMVNGKIYKTCHWHFSHLKSLFIDLKKIDINAINVREKDNLKFDQIG